MISEAKISDRKFDVCSSRGAHGMGFHRVSSVLKVKGSVIEELHRLDYTLFLLDYADNKDRFEKSEPLIVTCVKQLKGCPDLHYSYFHVSKSRVLDPLKDGNSHSYYIGMAEFLTAQISTSFGLRSVRRVYIDRILCPNIHVIFTDLSMPSTVSDKDKHVADVYEKNTFISTISLNN